MHHLKVSFKAATFSLALLLAACSDGLPQKQTESFTQILSLNIEGRIERRALEAEYGGKIIAWHPQSGFAILGLSEAASVPEAEMSLLTEGAGENEGQNDGDANEDVFQTPEVMVGATHVWGGGRRAWGGGKRAWGSSNSSTPTTFTENIGLWEQIRLRQGQNETRNLGHGIKVAIIDTGLDLAHPAFEGRLAPASEWKDFVDGGVIPQEVAGGAAYGHGTAVADVVLQVAPRVTLLPIRVLEPDGSGDVDDVVRAIDWAVKKGAEVINLSLGSEVPVSSLSLMIEYAAWRGVYVISSSGNTGDRNVTYPAAESMVGQGSAKYRSIGVGSVDAFNRKSSFSTYGDRLELVAPGELLYTAFPEEQVAYWSGTSFAAPIVSGALALGLGQDSGDDDEGHSDQLAEDIGSRAQDVSDINLDVDLGKGLIDVREFLRNIRSGDD